MDISINPIDIELGLLNLSLILDGGLRELVSSTRVY